MAAIRDLDVHVMTGWCRLTRSNWRLVGLPTRAPGRGLYWWWRPSNGGLPCTAWRAGSSHRQDPEGDLLNVQPTRVDGCEPGHRSGRSKGLPTCPGRCRGSLVCQLPAAVINADVTQVSCRAWSLSARPRGGHHWRVPTPRSPDILGRPARRRQLVAGRPHSGA